METQQTVATWDDVREVGTEFVKFVDKEEHVYALKNWTLFNVKEKKFGTQTGEMVDAIKFTCDVVGIDGKLVKKVISTSSSRFQLAIKSILSAEKPESVIFVQITRVGTGNATNYLAKKVAATELVK